LTSKADTDGTTADWLADRALRGVIGAVLRLPYEKRVPMMGAALRHVIGPLVGYRKRAEDNLSLIYPDMPFDERRALAEKCCDNLGRTLIENYSWKEFGERLAATAPTGEGLAPLESAAKEKRPVIFVTGHFGNHEAPRHVLTHKGYTIGGLYRPMQNPFFNEHYAQTMTSWGGPVFAQLGRGSFCL
jgi:KDO2-lipid IV(A) lauroyltransferase